ncbi:MAG: hypothetical protein E7Z86_09670 [Methanosphaera stadtmanae]|jgi:hypothetical protein|nr:hypothetical protein [Methanosphaera stadtmanae]
MSPIVIITIIWSISLGIPLEYFYYRIFKMKIFNLKDKCYFIVSEDKLRLLKEKLIEEDIDEDYIKFDGRCVTLLSQKRRIPKDGNLILLNHKGRLIEKGILLPIFIIILFLPMIIFLIQMRNVLLFEFIFVEGFMLYSIFIIYLKTKFSKIKDYDEDTCYKHTYITYMMHYNKVFIISVAFVLFGYLPTRANILLIVLLIILIRVHLNLFIDKIDKWLPWNVLEIHNTDRRNKIEYALAMFLLGFCNMFLAIYPLHITF